MVVNMSLALLTSQLAAGSSNSLFTAAMFAVLMTSLVCRLAQSCSCCTTGSSAWPCCWPA